MNNLEQYYWQ